MRLFHGIQKLLTRPFLLILMNILCWSVVRHGRRWFQRETDGIYSSPEVSFQIHSRAWYVRGNLSCRTITTSHSSPVWKQTGSQHHSKAPRARSYQQSHLFMLILCRNTVSTKHWFPAFHRSMGASEFWNLEPQIGVLLQARLLQSALLSWGVPFCGKSLSCHAVSMTGRYLDRPGPGQLLPSQVFWTVSLHVGVGIPSERAAGTVRCFVLKCSTPPPELVLRSPAIGKICIINSLLPCSPFVRNVDEAKFSTATR